MKKTLKLSLYLSLILCIQQACKTTQPGVRGLDTCKNLPNIEFEDNSIGTDIEKTMNLLIDLAGSAKTDAETSKVITAEAAANIKSEFGKKLKQNVSSSQDVSDDFWEQNITLTQLLCFTESQSNRKDLTKEQKNTYVTLLVQIISDRNEYLKQRSQKKNQ